MVSDESGGAEPTKEYRNDVWANLDAGGGDAVNCPKCGWPMKLIRTKKVLTSFLASFRCMNSQCRHEQTEIGNRSK